MVESRALITENCKKAKEIYSSQGTKCPAFHKQDPAFRKGILIIGYISVMCIFLPIFCQ